MSLYNKYIVDSNLLLLFIIGSIDDGVYIRKSKRLGSFTENDYHIVANLIENAKEVAITPYIAAEVSNLIDLSGFARGKAFEIARLLFSEFTSIPSCVKDDVQDDGFLQFGITDNALIRLADDYIIFTHDERLSEPLFDKNSSNVLLLNMLREII